MELVFKTADLKQKLEKTKGNYVNLAYKLESIVVLMSTNEVCDSDTSYACVDETVVREGKATPRRQSF